MVNQGSENVEKIHESEEILPTQKEEAVNNNEYENESENGNIFESFFKKEKKKSKLSETNLLIDFLALIRDICVCFLIAYCIANFLINPIRVDGSSMYPTIEHGDVGFSNIIGYKLFDVERFDIVVVFEDSLDEYVIKRVIGLPNETVQYIDNQLYINGQSMSEEFLDEAYCSEMSMLMNDNFTEDFGPVTLKENEYFIMGDNRPKSSDSRSFGAITKEQIKSKNTFILYPFSHFGSK